MTQRYSRFAVVDSGWSVRVLARRNYCEWEWARRRSRVPLREASMLRKTHALCENSTFWLVGGRVMKVTATSSICIWVRQQLEKRRIHSSHWRSTPCTVFSSTQERPSTELPLSHRSSATGSNCITRYQLYSKWFFDLWCKIHSRIMFIIWIYILYILKTYAFLTWYCQ